MSPRKKRRSQRAGEAETGTSPADSELRMPHLRWILLGVVVLVSTGVVVGAFNPAPHSGGDNAGYVTLAYSLVSHGTYTDLYDPAQLPHTKYPPVFPALLALLMLLGARTWTALKTVAAVSTVAATVFTYLWAERRLGPGRAVGVAVLVALSSSVVYYSHWVLSDPTFLALTMVGLWAFDRADEEGARPGWLVIGVAAAGLAYFTRSAGLPLLAALGGWLALRRRWRALAGAALAVGIPAFLWWLRARAVGQIEYTSEFWMVNPYDPSLGHVGVGGLLARIVGNVRGYVGTHIPTGIVGKGGGPGILALGVILVGLGLMGWLRRGTKRIGVVELFLPLYVGLILLWPEVWSGDRFALPLLPILFVFAVEVLTESARRLGRTTSMVVGFAALLVVLLPAFGSWLGATRQASACASLTEAGSPFACYGPRFTDFADAATWSGANLPEGSVVLSRKPRIFFVLSGLRSRTFPFEQESGAHLSLADSLDARYELLDQIDGLAGRYVGGAIQRDPGAFCAVRAFGRGTGVGTRLFGVLPPDDRVAPEMDEDTRSVRIRVCPDSYVRSGADLTTYPSSPPSSRIPLLDGLDP